MKTDTIYLLFCLTAIFLLNMYYNSVARETDRTYYTNLLSYDQRISKLERDNEDFQAFITMANSSLDAISCRLDETLSGYENAMRKGRK